MLTAAMVLGLIGGIAYFIGGGSEAILRHHSGEPVPWWIVSLIPIGIIGAIGGALARSRPSLAGILLLVGGAAAIVIGFASYVESIQEQLYYALPFPRHSFTGLFFYLPVPIFALIIAAALALAGRREVESEGSE